MSGLHVDYRPETLEDFVGNTSMVANLQRILDREKNVPHCFMFTGPSGCGKTTLARIVATKLGCSENDFRELDAADFRGIDTVREIRRHMQYRPTDSDCRVWLLDECHKLTTDAQEAFLKATEEPPKHVYFIFGTTEPEKLKTTFKRRCMQFEVQALSEKAIQKYLKGVVKAEEKKVPQEILEQIASDSIGSLGIALMTLDKIIDLDEDQMAEAAERTVAEQNETIELCKALIGNAKWPTVAGILKNLTQEPESIRRAVLGYFNSVLLNGHNADSTYLVMEAFSEPLYNTGRPGLTMACYEAVISRK